ncbi:MAG: hypothetical protein QOE57_1810, partial [Acidimicrobiaceae bacterium]|nr:hypothetical protein [Acidimicrobiaceae bacterium]
MPQLDECAWQSAVTVARRLVAALIPGAMAVLIAACQSTPALPAPPAVSGPPAIPDAQSAVDAPLFVGQSTFPAPLSPQVDLAPRLATTRVDGGNTGVVDGPAPLGRAPVTGSAAVAIQAPLLWGRRGDLTAGCQIELAPGLDKSCLAAVDASTLAVQARWLPPGQDLNLASAIVDDADRVIVTTRQRHVFVVSRPDSAGGQFRVVRDIDLNGHLGESQGLLGSVVDASGNVWFTSGGVAPSGPDAGAGSGSASGSGSGSGS